MNNLEYLQCYIPNLRVETYLKLKINYMALSNYVKQMVHIFKCREN